MLKLKRLYSVVPALALCVYLGILFISPYKGSVTDDNDFEIQRSFREIEALIHVQDNNEQVNETVPENMLLASAASAAPALPEVTAINAADLAERGNTTRTVKDYTHKISAENVNLRGEPNTSSNIITRLQINDRINIVDKSGDWSKVSTAKDVTGWVKNDFILTKNAVIPVKKKVVIPVGQQAVNTAKKYLGVKYVWGGTSPKGFDCSGLVKYVYAKYGVRLNRVAADQARQGTRVTRDKLKAGDLVFFDTDGGKNYINHVGMYIGGGRFIHASSGRSTGHKVVISSLNEKFYSKSYITARRFFK